MSAEFTSSSKEASNPAVPRKRTNLQRILFIGIAVAVLMIVLLGMLILMGTSPVASFTYKQF
ncbi:hypothetical protein HY256_03690 [Candidatus Sumerlaeota bacterium]|nr:hypothetical protein [Candidatus Sumerlaeota bacterium]